MKPSQRSLSTYDWCRSSSRFGCGLRHSVDSRCRCLQHRRLCWPLNKNQFQFTSGLAHILYSWKYLLGRYWFDGAHHVSRVITRVGLLVEHETRRTGERMRHDAQIGWTAVQAPEILFAIARMRIEAFVLALEICADGS